VQEIAKEEKLAKERLRDMRLNVGKTFKEVGANGIYS